MSNVLTACPTCANTEIGYASGRVWCCNCCGTPFNVTLMANVSTIPGGRQRITNIISGEVREFNINIGTAIDIVRRDIEAYPEDFTCFDDVSNNFRIEGISVDEAREILRTAYSHVGRNRMRRG